MSQNANDSKKETIMPDVIFSYTQDEALEDGVLVLVGYAALGFAEKQERVIFTRTLFEQGYSDQTHRRDLMLKGFTLLLQPHHEDTPTMKLRVIEKDKIWVIWNSGEGFTFLTPEDY